MAAPIAPRIAQIDAEIRRTSDARAKALARRRRILAASLATKIKRLQKERARLAGQIAYKGGGSRKISLPSLPSVFSRGANRPPPGVRDPYAGVQPTAKNAATLAAFYYARSKKRLITRAARAYYLLRLSQVKSFLPGKTGPGKLVEAAKQHRKMALRAKLQRNFAAATRFTAQAASLEQQARSMEIQSASEPKDYYTEDTSPGDSAVEPADVTESSSDVAVAEEKPWYMNPLVWGGGVVGLIVLAKAAGGKGKGGGSVSRKSYTVSKVSRSGARSRSGGGARTSTSLTRSL